MCGEPHPTKSYTCVLPKGHGFVHGAYYHQYEADSQLRPGTAATVYQWGIEINDPEPDGDER